MKRILVPIDGSEFSARAVDKAVELQKAFGSEITLMNVIDLHRYIYLTDVPDELVRQVKEIRTNLLRDAKSKFGENADKVQTLTLEGDPAETIIDQISNNNYDLVIMGSHGMGKVRRFLIGSVAHKVLQEINIPILIVR